MMRLGKTRAFALLSALFVAFTLVSTDFADARRGGSFGSRGTRTFQTAPPTRTAPNPTGPVERTMTPNPGPTARQNQTVGQQRPGFFNNFGGSLMRGLVLGGILGLLLGYGFGGFAGMLGFILQLALVAMLAMVAMRWWRSRQEPAAAGAPRGYDSQSGSTGGTMFSRESAQPQNKAGSFAIPSFGSGGTTQTAIQTEDIRLDQADLDTFERRLTEVQEAFAREDNAALRRLSTPEMVSFFSEELADNAKRGVQNDVRDTRLVQADVAEAWREGDEDYATAAFRYASIDVMRDRDSGEIVEGEDAPSETTELWTFVRRQGEDWKLSAIQEAQAS